MKRFLLACIAALAFYGAPAFGADMPLKAPPVISGNNWTGCYLGGNLGGAWSGKDYTAGPPGYWNVVGASDGSHTSSGFVGGGQVGCDYQFNTNVVFGVQAMWDGAGLKDDNFIPNFAVCCDARLDSDVQSFGTVAARLGYLLNPTLLLSGSVGWGWIGERFTNTCPAQSACGGTTSLTRDGLDAGVALTWWFNRNWDAFVAYDHMWLGSKTITFPTAIATPPFQESVRQDFDKALVGVDYRLN